MPPSGVILIPRIGPTHNVQSAYGWIKKGVRKEIPANTGRSRLNLSGAIDILNHHVLIQENQTLNARSTIGFFQEIEKAYTQMNSKVGILARRRRQFLCLERATIAE